MATSGMTSRAQKPNMIHLLSTARRALRRSNSLGANGLAAAGAPAGTGMARAAVSFMSHLVRLLYSLDDQIGGHIDAAGDYEQDDAKDEEHPIMVAAVAALAHRGRDGRRHRSHPA